MAEPIVFVLVYYSRHTANSPSTSVIAVLLPAVGIEPTSRYQRTFLRRKPHTTRLPKYLSNCGGGNRTHVAVPKNLLTTEASYHSAKKVLIELYIHI